MTQLPAYKKLHKFENNLAESNSSRDLLNKFYMRRFKPDSIIEITKDLKKQKQWVDKELVFPDHIINIEEKTRKNSYRDVLLELKSSVQANTEGWATDPNKISNYLVYYIEPDKILYLFKYRQLRKATIENMTDWIDRYSIQLANNGSYISTNVAVPYYVIKESWVECTLHNLKLMK